MNNLKVDVQCPFCGNCTVGHVRPAAKKWICHECKMPLFLKYAADNPDEVDEHGFGRVAYEPFRHNEVVREIDEVFGLVNF